MCIRIPGFHPHTDTALRGAFSSTDARPMPCRVHQYRPKAPQEAAVCKLLQKKGSHAQLLSTHVVRKSAGQRLAPLSQIKEEWPVRLPKATCKTRRSQAMVLRLQSRDHLGRHGTATGRLSFLKVLCSKRVSAQKQRVTTWSAPVSQGLGMVTKLDAWLLAGAAANTLSGEARVRAPPRRGTLVLMMCCCGAACCSSRGPAAAPPATASTGTLTLLL